MRLKHLALSVLPAAAVVTAVACISDPVYPGNQLMGTFQFEARLDPAGTTCDASMPEFAQLDDAGVFRFEGTFSKNEDGGVGWFTVQGFNRDAKYEGQTVDSTLSATAPRASCGTDCKDSKIEETLKVTLFSDSQSRELNRDCLRFDGGTPDGSPPGPTENGYDVAMACGSLTDVFLPGPCTCTPSTCKTAYKVQGVRRD
ncbi:hypothetical protein NVS55_34365 [Myxococcus stipitatus]|uniref:Putative lipoprotein n=1 Tax=Myxococcus stipitatus (strain DSM 14675 / JCM 12634 / Mx s8) TaxID=1278073 RepID=L7UL89_MYXSD|nr:hypothetical protein [Myxococcus stipitatus]AGC48292.1 putative lipoprotein [Myxococcus stipitatus DSM 14675]